MRTLDDDVKANLLQRSVNHLSDVTRERSLYQQDVAAAKLSLENHAHLTAHSLSVHDPNSQDAVMHYSFDYAQQIQIPHDSQQVGPLYFLAPYKVALFGIACEPASKMVIYTVPEIAVVDKGSNSVLSFLHHFFSTFSYGEKMVHLRADNCTGQNKNRYMMAYLCWRILCAMHTRITLSFLPVGHTKFYPDLGFGVFKRHLRQCSVNTVDEVAQCIADSSPLSKMLIPQVVANDNGDIFVTTYEWQVMFADVKTVPELKKFHHFVFDAQHPGTVKCMVSSESEAVSFTLCRAEGGYIVYRWIHSSVRIKQLQEFLKSDHWLRRYCILSGGTFYFEPPCMCKTNKAQLVTACA